MVNSTRTTVYLEPEIYRALKLKSAESDRTLSDIVNQAVLELLREDSVDLAAVEKRRGEPSRSFEEVLKDLKRDKLI
ncbi:MAG: hypothetical protein OXI53_02565 [Nitrospira sp.]|nr:hypothetical protein [Nitrospira sp.]MDE0404173.1 hypothetical protein [Nitrospira sp.]MDE0487381.1 hypothetical protein [Nitrospira sp.]